MKIFLFLENDKFKVYKFAIDFIKYRDSIIWYRNGNDGNNKNNGYDNNIKDNLFHFSKRQKNFLKSFCSTMFNRKEESSKFQVAFQFLKDKYNRLVEICTLKGYNYKTNW